MRLCHFAAVLTISMGGFAWAQPFPDVDNRVPELRVTELAQSGNHLKVTVQNVSTRTIRRVSAVLGKYKVDQDWSSLAGGGVMPNATASLTISMAGLSAGGSRHHPAALPPLELSNAVFADTGQTVPQAPKAAPKETVAQPPPTPLPPPLAKAKPAPVSETPSARVEPKPVTPKAEVDPPAVAATPAPRVQQTVPPVAAPAAPKVVAPRTQSIPPPSEVKRSQETVQQDQPPPAPPAAPAPPRSSGHPGTREQGVQDELSRLLSLIEPYEIELASPSPRPALRKMIAAVVAEQHAWAASQPAVTGFDQGQRSAVETFVFGLQAIYDRRDLEDDTLRAQVQRFLKNRRQSLNR